MKMFYCMIVDNFKHLETYWGFILWLLHLILFKPCLGLVGMFKAPL